ncbi:MAG: glycoside hydrolase family 3 N-terminal domain-containing protein [Anderseniella sp.]|nr:glycoside hydrolase family 3 N-terminal domain-containing protein [Anderseniella sp.]
MASTRNLLCIALLALLAFTSSVAHAQTEVRVALVIGNGAYSHVPALPNPRNDSQKIAQKLTAIGFQVTEQENLTNEGFRRALRDFARLAKRKGFKHQPSAAWVASKSPETARQIYLGMARELKQAGFNVNFGPVVDINLNPDNPIIGKLGRSFGNSDAKVMTYAREFIEAHWQHGIVTCAKHFPGHGSASGDTHKVEAHIDAINRNLETQVYLDLAQKKLLDSVMVAHLLTKNERSLPATLDPERYQFLRSMVGFQGVAFSDDMNMEAVRKRFSFEDGLVMTVNAGTDVVVLGNVLHYDPQIAKKAFDILLASVKAGKIKKSRIEEAYRRIIKLKNKYH